METDSNAGLGQSRRYIRFGPFQIDQQRQQVSRGGTRVKLRGKAYQALLALIAKRGQVVTREELKRTLWSSDTHVNFDANVNMTVNKLRQFLGDSTERPVYIETIPRKGYSFVLKLEYANQPFPQSSFASPAGTEQDIPQEPEKSGMKSDRWPTLEVIALILAGILLGAGIATFLIARFGPSLRL